MDAVDDGGLAGVVAGELVLAVVAVAAAVVAVVAGAVDVVEAWVVLAAVDGGAVDDGSVVVVDPVVVVVESWAPPGNAPRPTRRTATPTTLTIFPSPLVVPGQ
ncbi:MAG: hypothetical protein ACFCVK_21130 [Acidimicrobiales bacterium]